MSLKVRAETVDHGQCACCGNRLATCRPVQNQHPDSGIHRLETVSPCFLSRCSGLEFLTVLPGRKCVAGLTSGASASLLSDCALNYVHGRFEPLAERWVAGLNQAELADGWLGINLPRLVRAAIASQLVLTVYLPRCEAPQCSPFTARRASTDNGKKFAGMSIV